MGEWWAPGTETRRTAPLGIGVMIGSFFFFFLCWPFYPFSLALSFSLFQFFFQVTKKKTNQTNRYRQETKKSKQIKVTPPTTTTPHQKASGEKASGDRKERGASGQ